MGMLDHGKFLNPHKFDYDYEEVMEGTGKYIGEEEIKEKAMRHVRKCKVCGKEQWQSHWGLWM